MSTNLAGFDAREIAPFTPMGLLPDGRYAATIVDSGMKDSKSGSGSYLELEFEVCHGPFSGRRLWRRLSLVHTNPLAVDRAKSELSAICWAVDVLQPQDSSDLHDRPLTIVVKKTRRKDNGEMANDIRDYDSPDSLSMKASAEESHPDRNSEADCCEDYPERHVATRENGQALLEPARPISDAVPASSRNGVRIPAMG